MEAYKIWETYPRLFHMAAKDSWPSIRTRGLLSTSALLVKYQITGQERSAIESCHRPEYLTITKTGLPPAKIRDQKPMSDSGLIRSLGDNLNPTDWYKMLNKRTFFWLRHERLLGLLNGRAYRDDEHDVLILHTQPLVENYVSKITLTPMNSGCTVPFPHPRGIETFRSIEDFPFEDRKRKAGKNAIVELAVEGGVQNISRFIIKVVRMKKDRVLRTIYKS